MSEKNIKITVAYNGKNFNGWQKQKDSLGIQGELEFACKSVFSLKEIEVIGSGRTDAGVHALGQVANFKVDTTIPTEKFPEILNNRLPKDISVLSAEEVAGDFHSRHTAKRKTYRYQIYRSKIRSPFLKDISYQVKYDLDVEKMKREVKFLIGKHDFCGFMSSGSSIKNTVREIFDASVFEQDELLIIEVCGSGFLYNMVRIIAGTMVDIGRGKIDESMKQIIESKDRGRAGHTAPPQGLFLKYVEY